ncbi:MAG TPA: hypothetical protein VJ870_18260 [Amycolatopsis sp.]|nr:hypothetical protein [Amycolatopsis sp.]
MSIFGQVWLWSAAAFLLGVLLTWVFLVRPAQARSRALERRLAAAHAQSKAADSTGQERRPMTRAAERQAARERVPVAPVPTAHVPVNPVPPVPVAPVVPEPVAAAEPAAVAEPAPEPAWREPSADAVSSVLEPELDSERTSIFRPQEPPAQPEQRGSLFDPSYEAPAETEPPAYAFSDEPAPDEHVGETTHILPRRQPRTPPRGGFESPQPVQPSMRPVERRAPVGADEGGRSGSLFEPVVRPKAGGAAHSAPEPPPARSHAAAGSPVPPGPFGPGSAMPMPGGASPSDDFTVKASVTALRYCTDDSPQFPRMIAEVWFRSVADAERVGFRPLT